MQLSCIVFLPRSPWQLSICNNRFFSDESFHSASRDSFSNFLRHVKRAHPTELEEFERRNSKSQKSSGQKSHTSISNFLNVGNRIGSDKKSRLHFVLTEMIVEDNYPLTMIQKEGFRRFVKVRKLDCN